MDKKKAGAAALGVVGAIAVAIGALDRGEKIDCSKEAARERFLNNQEQFAACLKRDDADCAIRVDAEFNRTLEACEKP